MVLQPGSWDGSHIFYPRGFHVLTVTARFRNACLNADLTNFVFIPASGFKGSYPAGRVLATENR
jgi:hypothetical protein